MVAKKSSSPKRGFAAMSASRQREIAAMGGRASHGSRKKSTSKRASSTSHTDQGSSG